MDVFVSVGTGLSMQQETFVTALEARLRAEGFNPCTIGRNFFSAEAPLKAVTELMDRCQGTVVVALERYYFPSGIERRGSDREQAIGESALPTAWNQIEAAMAYGRGHPLLVLVDARLRGDGLLEPGNDWFVQRLETVSAALGGAEFNGVLADWRERVRARPAPAAEGKAQGGPASPADMSVIDMLGRLRPGEIWKVGLTLAVLLGGAFTLGTRLSGFIAEAPPAAHAASAR